MQRASAARSRKRLNPYGLGFPLFLGTYAQFFRGASPTVPTGIANLTSGYGSLTVTGAAGATTLTVNATNVGALADYAGTYGCVIQHNDGTYACYTALNVNAGAGTIDIYPTLNSAATATAFSNLFSSSNGQHLTSLGYNALGRYLVGLKKRDGWIQRAASRLNFTPGGITFGDAFALAGGLTTTGVVAGSSIAKGLFSPATLNIQAAPSNAVVTTLADRSYLTGTGVKGVGINASVAGAGATHTCATLGGRSGMLEAFVAIGGELSGTAASQARVTVVVDGVTLYNQLISTLTRVAVPFTGSSGTLSVTVETDTHPTCIKVGPVHWWVWGSEWGSVDPAGALFEADARVALFCDSWGTQGTNALQAGIEAALGSSLVVNASSSGQQASWAIANYDTLVDPYQPDYVILDFLINDQATGLLKAQEWVNNVRALTDLIISRGATPVYLRNLSTASLSQVQTLIGYSNHLLDVWPVIG